MNSYSAWRAPSSPYPRVVYLTLIITFSLVFSFGLMNRLAGYDNSNGGSIPEFALDDNGDSVQKFHRIDGNNPFVLGGFSIGITVLISNYFISLFVWHWSFPLDENTKEAAQCSTTINESATAESASSNESSINELSCNATVK